MEFENQGYPVFPVHLEVAKEYCKQNGLPLNDKNLLMVINKLAKEKAESYTPNPILGKNPASRVSNNIRKIIGDPIYNDKNGYLAKRIKNKSSRQAAQIEMGGAINGLSQMILKHMYGFKTTRRPNVDKSDPKGLTDYEYVASGPGNNFSKEQRDIYNKTIDINRHIRLVVESYLFQAVNPLLVESKDSFYKTMLAMGYKELDAKFIRSLKNTKEFAMLVSYKMFGPYFRNLSISEILRRHKWTSRGTLRLGPGQTIKLGPPKDKK